jgi:hypothetical protein
MNLWTQLAASGVLVVVMTLVHAFGIILVTRLLKLEDERLRAQPLGAGAFLLLSSIGLALFALHLTEIALFAFFYVAVGAVADIETGLFLSASYYSTLGQPDVGFPIHWRIVGAMEGLIGFLLIGWSIAVFIADMNKVLRRS